MLTSCALQVVITQSLTVTNTVLCWWDVKFGVNGVNALQEVLVEIRVHAISVRRLYP